MDLGPSMDLIKSNPREHGVVHLEQHGAEHGAEHVEPMCSSQEGIGKGFWQSRHRKSNSDGPHGHFRKFDVVTYPAMRGVQ